MKSYIQCIPGNVRLNRWGQIVSHHVREPSWDLNYYITQLFKELKSWRLVYWKLWGHAHYLYCCLCEMYFPVYQVKVKLIVISYCLKCCLLIAYLSFSEGSINAIL